MAGYLDVDKKILRMNGNHFTLITYLVLFSVVTLVIYVVLINKANAKKSSWGINFKALKSGKVLKCPSCSTELPKIRKSKNFRQALWGGFTCESCGKEYDKWLNEIHS